MVRLVLALVSGAVVGVVLGVLARALMRLVAIGMAIETELNRGPSIAVVSIFVLSAAGAGLAAALDLQPWLTVLVVVVTSAPLLLMGTVFTIGETGEILDRDLTLPWTIELVGLSALIAGVALVTPYAGWRAGRGAGRAREDGS